MTNHYVFKSPIGLLDIRGENDKITGLSLQVKESDAAFSQKFTQHSELLYEAYRQLDEYFSGKRTEFALPLYYTGTVFQKQVWKELQSIPYGETRSYQDIAAAIGNPKAVRAIGQANHRNPIMIIVPCHRVIHKNGDISGFACGVEAKKYLLDLESTVCSKSRWL